MIWRIFNLGKGDRTGMYIYLDPDTLRENGELEFSTHTWAVKPLKGPGERSGNTGINDTKKDSGSANVGGFGSSASKNVPGSSNRAFGSSTLESQENTDSLGGNPSGSKSATSINNPTIQSPPRSSLFGTTKPSSTLGRFSAFDGVSLNNETPRYPVQSLFGSNATSSNSGIPKASPEGGLFGANTTVANNPIPTTSTTGLNFDTAPGMTRLSGFDSTPNPVSTGFNAGTVDSDASRNAFLKRWQEAINGNLKQTGDGHSKSEAYKSTSPSATGIGPSPKATSTGFDFGSIVNSDGSEGTSRSASGRWGLNFFPRTPSENPSGKGLFGSTEGNQSNKSAEAPSASTAFGTKSVSSNHEALKSMWSTQPLGTFGSLPSATTGAFGANPPCADEEKPETTSTAKPLPLVLDTTGSVFGRAALPTQSSASQSATSSSEFGASPSTLSAMLGTEATASTSHEANKSTPLMAFLSGACEARSEASPNPNTHKATPPEPTIPQRSLFNLPPRAKTPSQLFPEGQQKPLFAPRAPDLSPSATEGKAQAHETQPAATRDDTSDEQLIERLERLEKLVSLLG